jgi:hypothetical protein
MRTGYWSAIPLLAASDTETAAALTQLMAIFTLPTTSGNNARARRKHVKWTVHHILNGFAVADSGRTAIFCWARIACRFDVIAYPFHVVGRSTHLRYWPHVEPANSVGAPDGGLLIGSDLPRSVPPLVTTMQARHNVSEPENRVTRPNGAS